MVPGCEWCACCAGFDWQVAFSPGENYARFTKWVAGRGSRVLVVCLLRGLALPAAPAARLHFLRPPPQCACLPPPSGSFGLLRPADAPPFAFVVLDSGTVQQALGAATECWLETGERAHAHERGGESKERERERKEGARTLVVLQRFFCIFSLPPSWGRLSCRRCCCCCHRLLCPQHTHNTPPLTLLTPPHPLPRPPTTSPRAMVQRVKPLLLPLLLPAAPGLGPG